MVGRVWVDLEGTKIDSPIEREILMHANTVGVILFARNYASKQQLRDLIIEIKELTSNQVLIAIDHEGGRIERFPGCFTQIPAPKIFGQWLEHDRKSALKQLTIAGNIIAFELIDMGIDLCLAPVLDLDRGISQVLDTRMYHRDPEIVIECAKAFISGLNFYGMQAVGKHFPGHGGCNMDSHIELAIDERELSEILSEDLLPYIKLKNKLGAIMLGHLIFPKVDKLPVTLSSVWTNIYRGSLGLELLSIVDCLSMKGISSFGSLIDVANQSLNAGCDTLIISQQSRQSLLQTLNNISIISDLKLQAKIDRLRGERIKRNQFQEPEEVVIMPYSER